MKCQKCEKNEATFFFTQSINGAVTQGALCADCARQAGLMREPALRSGGLADSVFGDVFDGFFPGVFGLRSGLPDHPAFDVFAPRRPSVTDFEPREYIPRGDTLRADGDLKRKIRMNALRERMKLAAESDDFETAMKLRDELRALESAEKTEGGSADETGR